MISMLARILSLCVALLCSVTLCRAVDYSAWSNSGSLFINTTPEGANLPGSATEADFSMLVRLNGGNFTFSQAQADGRDIRFATTANAALSYQIEQWDSINGAASVWVKIPTIAGNAQQEIRMYWGNSAAVSESSGAAVFSAANGFASVLHMNETVQDAVGTVTASDTGTTLSTGVIGKSRHFANGKGINCGTNITTFPSGSAPHSSEVWFRAEVASTNVLAWGIDTSQGKVVMQLASPPHINVDCWFSGGGVAGVSAVPLSQWVHVAHTYVNGQAKIYVNGVLDGTTTGGAPMNIPYPARMYVGGWYDSYSFIGDIDEVRISSVTRSADWIKMEYENQRQLQTLVGTLVQAGSTFSAAPTSVSMNEGTSATITGQAGGAQKVYWIRRQNSQDTVIASDQFSVTVDAGRVTGNQSFVIQFKGIYPTEIKTVDVPVTITEFIPDPIFTLTAPATWDGRQTITVTPNISNLAALQAKSLANLTYTWAVVGVAVVKQVTPGVLTLLRSQGSGPMTVTLVADNGGALVTATTTIVVQEPATNAWVARTSGANEKAVNNQFYARDDTGMGTLYYNGTLSQTGSSVFLRVYKDSVLTATLNQVLPVSKAYAFTVPLQPGLFNYGVVFGYTDTGGDTVLDTVANLACGDAYIIEGQSNAVATDSLPSETTTSPWIRSYGWSGGGWGSAVRNGTQWWIGYWGMDLAVDLVATYNMPICIINGAVSGTRIDQHQANPANRFIADGYGNAIYANLLNRVTGAKLTHGIRAILWHQG